MTHPSKVKGNAFERELVNAARALGLEAQRAWGSDGRNLPGCGKEVDVLVAGRKVQCKRKGELPAYLRIPEGCEAVAVRQDRGPGMVLVKLEDWLRGMVPQAAAPTQDAMRSAVLCLRTEVNCRIQHGADSGGHLDYVQDKLDALLNTP